MGTTIPPTLKGLKLCSRAQITKCILMRGMWRALIIVHPSLPARLGGNLPSSGFVLLSFSCCDELVSCVRAGFTADSWWAYCATVGPGQHGRRWQCGWVKEGFWDPASHPVPLWSRYCCSCYSLTAYLCVVWRAALGWCLVSVCLGQMRICGAKSTRPLLPVCAVSSRSSAVCASRWQNKISRIKMYDKHQYMLKLFCSVNIAYGFILQFFIFVICGNSSFYASSSYLLCCNCTRLSSPANIWDGD